MPDEIMRRYQGDEARSVILKSDQDKGMALVKSKDGRMKWLTVSADPSHSSSWDERVKNWATKLGVCTQPASPGSLSTPLPTPPPSDPRVKQAWLPTSDQPRDPLASTGSTVSTASEPRSTEKSNSSGRMGGTRRAAGSFARGFLLGLGNGSSTSTTGCDTGTKPTSATVTSSAPTTVIDDQPMTLAFPSSWGKRAGIEEVPLVAAPSTTVGRDRWLKGALLTPERTRSCEQSSSVHPSLDSRGSSSESEDGEVRHENYHHPAINHENRVANPNHAEGQGDDQGMGRTNNLHSGSSAVSNEDTSKVSGITCGDDQDVAGIPDREVDDGMEWIEAGTAGTRPGGSRSSSTKSSGSSKKKKKIKGKSKAKTKKTSSVPKDQMRSEIDRDSKTASISSGASIKRSRKALHVSFGNVRMLEFTRDVGGCGVPSEGTWSLSLGLPFRETSVDVDEYEVAKVEILDARSEQLTKKQRQLATGETRQFDHRPLGQRNPLFERLGENERRKQLLVYACGHQDDLKEVNKAKQNGRKPFSMVGENKNGKDGMEAKHGSELSNHSQKISHLHFTNKSDEDFRELNALRKSRRQSQGCSCTCVRADKLTVSRLKEELNKRGLKASGSKRGLVKILQEVMNAEVEEDGGEGHNLCHSDECECAMDGVECHADLCSCCKGPQVGKKDPYYGDICRNPEGVYAYNSNTVKSYRAPFVTAKPVNGRDKKQSRSGSSRSENVR